MNEQRGEALSALLDGELDEQDRGELLDRLSGDEMLRHRWARYGLIGEVMRGDAMAAGDLAERVRAAVDEEPAVLAPAALDAPTAVARPAAWWKPAGGLALAAGLATVAVLGGRSLDRPDADVPVAAATASALAPAATVQPVATTGGGTRSTGHSRKGSVAAGA